MGLVKIDRIDPGVLHVGDGNGQAAAPSEAGVDVDWSPPHDPEANITKIKDVRTQATKCQWL
jgi:hypothetical protein